jgi:DNA polymerase-1
LLYRAFFALPSSIRGTDGRPVNALLGTANLILQVVTEYKPRAVALCFGAEAATYRVELYSGYHADRPEMPDELEQQWKDARAFFESFGWTVHHAGDLEADDLLGAFAKAETAAGGTTLIFSGDRDMFQCVDASVSVLFPGGKAGPTLIDAAGVRERYGIEPSQVPDFIALRGDPSDGIPGAKGIGEKTAASLLQEHESLDSLLELAQKDLNGLKRGVCIALRDQAGELLAYRDMATLRPIDVQRPADAPTDGPRAAEAARERGMARLADRLATFA